MRFDLVVNDLAGHAWTEKVIRMDSDGPPWRPFVHILDISQAIDLVLQAPRATSSTARSSTSAATCRTTRSARSPRSSPTRSPAAGRSSATARRQPQLPGQLRQDPRAPAVRDPLRRRARRPAAAGGLPGRGHDARSCSSHAATRASSRSSTCSRPGRSTSGSSGVRRTGLTAATPGQTRRSGMKLTPAGLDGSLPHRPHPRIGDDRGFFARTWDEAWSEQLGVETRAVQMNLSTNRQRGTIRGLHWQVRAVRGVEAPALHPRGGLRRGRRPASRFADVPPVAGPRPRRRDPDDGLRAGRLRPRLPGARGRRRGQLPGVPPVRAGIGARHPLG